MVPECYLPLVPPKPEPCFKYELEDGGSLPSASYVKTLIDLMRKKPTPEEVLTLVREIPNPLKGIPLNLFNCLSQMFPTTSSR